MRIRPFSHASSYDVFRNHLDQVCQEIDLLENDYVLKASLTELEEYFISKLLIEPLVLKADQKYILETKGTSVRVSDFGRSLCTSGICLVIAIPFEGDSILWNVEPSYSLGSYPEIEISSEIITLSYTFSDSSTDSEELKRRINSEVKILEFMVSKLQEEVEKHNSLVPSLVKKTIKIKREKALSSANVLASLGIPIKRQNEPNIYTIPTTRRKLSTQFPSVPTEKYAPEPVLNNIEYQHILKIMRSMSLVIERSPQTFALLEEEAIRNHFLIQLNGHYEGSVTGETFNAAGKTDILIRVDDKNVFIAECKFWKGIKAFSDAIDQLLGYLTWRDCKCALVIFNRNKDSSSLWEKMHEAMTKRPEHRRTINSAQNEDASYTFVKETNPGREIIITTQLFDIPVG